MSELDEGKTAEAVAAAIWRAEPWLRNDAGEIEQMMIWQGADMAFKIMVWCGDATEQAMSLAAVKTMIDNCNNATAAEHKGRIEALREASNVVNQHGAIGVIELLLAEEEAK